MLSTDHTAFLQAILFPTLYITPFPLVPLTLSSSVRTQLMTLLPTLLSKYKFQRYYHFYPTFNLHPYVLPFHLYCRLDHLISSQSAYLCVRAHFFSATREHCCTTLPTLFRMTSFLTTELLFLLLETCYFSFSRIHPLVPTTTFSRRTWQVVYSCCSQGGKSRL